MRNHPTGTAPNYTAACVVMFGVNLAWILLVVWIAYGFIAALLLAFALNHAIGWLQQQRRIHAVRSIRRGRR